MKAILLNIFLPLYLLFACQEMIFGMDFSQATEDVIDNEIVEKRLVSKAHELIGTPYRWGSMSAVKGFDCSGLLVFLFRSQAKIHLPRTTKAMSSANVPTIRRTDLRPGDAVFFKGNGKARIGHVGLYIGDGRFIHAPRTGKSVRIDRLDNRYWSASYKTAKRFHSDRKLSRRLASK